MASASAEFAHLKTPESTGTSNAPAGPPVLLRTRFEAAFWCERLGTYAIALDGAKRPCEVAASNAGHALWTGIAAHTSAQRIVGGFMRSEFFSGWGMRTLAATQARYNPMSYHNGSIWPHDNALIAVGMARYGHTDAAMSILTFRQRQLCGTKGADWCRVSRVAAPRDALDATLADLMRRLRRRAASRPSTWLAAPPG